LSGTEPINTSFPSNNHLLSTYEYILKSLVIGQIDERNKLVNPQIHKQDVSNNGTISKLEVGNTNGDNLLVPQSTNCLDEEVVLTNIRTLSKDTAEFRFRIKNGTFNFARFLHGCDWAGRHFAVTSSHSNKTRYYSVCLCLNELIATRHQLLLNNIQKLESNQSIVEPNLKADEMSDNTLEFYIKKYEQRQGLSKFIHELKTNDEGIIVRGPIGLGLEIDSNTTLTGTYVSFGGGTGVFCFLDFVAFVLRYVCHKIASEKFNTHKNNINDEDFSMVKGGFKLVYFATFADEEQAIYHENCLKLHELCQKYNLNIFEYHSRISTQGKKRWDTSFIQDKLGKEKTIEKVFICGPTKFLEDIKGHVLESKLVTENQIHLV